METERKYVDFDALLLKIYTKIVLWHNNDDGLSSIEMGRELKWLSKDIAEDVLTAFHGKPTEIKLDDETLSEKPENE